MERETESEENVKRQKGRERAGEEEKSNFKFTKINFANFEMRKKYVPNVSRREARQNESAASRGLCRIKLNFLSSVFRPAAERWRGT